MRLPWEIQPSLTRPRLQAVAAIFRDVRDEARRDHRPDLGDTGWGLGCRCYERGCYAITTRAATAEYRSWLSVADHSNLKFLFRIGDVPVKFYTGDPKHPPVRSRKRDEVELREQTELIELRGPGVVDAEVMAADELLWRLFIEVDQGQVAAITIEQVGINGRVYNPWTIPLDGASAAPVAEPDAGPPSAGGPDPLPYETRRPPVDVPPLDDLDLRRDPGEEKPREDTGEGTT